MEYCGLGKSPSHVPGLQQCESAAALSLMDALYEPGGRQEWNERPQALRWHLGALALSRRQSKRPPRKDSYS